MAEIPKAADKAFPERDDPRTEWLLRHEPWLRMLARCEIDGRFQAKFSASDAVQQTLLAAWRDWDACRAEEEPQRLAWLRRILAHQIAHLARRYAGTKKRDIGREVSLQQSINEASARLEQLLPAAQSSPSQKLVRAEQRNLLAEALERLPEDYREVLLLRHLQDLPHEEIARRMGRSPGAVRMLWVRALARLRGEMGQS